MARKTGTSGNDTLYGGAGGDELVGLAGDDTYGVYSNLDTVVEQPGEGNDRVLTFASYALSAGASIETLSTAINAGTDPISLTGNELVQFIVGNNGTNTIDGRGGGDALIGLGGNDVYYVSSRNDFVFEDANGGTDTVYVRSDFNLSAGSSVEVIRPADPTGTAPLFIAGNEQAQEIHGNAGNNLINSGGKTVGSIDLLYGGAGDDTYRVFGADNGTGEAVIELTGEGNDAVYTSGSYAMERDVSIELLSAAVGASTDPISLTGNSVGQVIIGNYGNNNIDGSGRYDSSKPIGADTLIGLLGNDTYSVASQADVVLENPGEGSDSVFVTSSYRLRAGTSVETLSTRYQAFTGTIDLVGNEVSQVIIGNYGVNLLDGGGGNDTLIGLDGNDIFRFSTALGAGNVDDITNYGTGSDTIQLDRGIFTALGLGTLSASALAIGSAAADADDRIIYNAQTGALSYDADGTGSTAAIQFATLGTGLTAAQLRIQVAPTEDRTTVNITYGGAFLLGGATGTGIDVAATYPEATSFVFGARPAGSTPGQTFIFGPNSTAAGHPTYSFVDAYAVNGFDFSQLGTGLKVVAAGDYQTTAGVTVVPRQTPDVISGNSVPKMVTGTPYDDQIDLYTAPSASTIGGSPPPGTIQGGAGNDTLRGYRNLEGGAGSDVLIGDLGTRMTGGTGNDVFRIPVNTKTPGTNSGTTPNVLVDYDPATDQIQIIRNVSAGGLELGQLDPSRFFQGAGATTLDQRIIYNPETGALSLDSNGSAGDPSSSGLSYGVFAYLPAHLDLTAANFTVIGG